MRNIKSTLIVLLLIAFPALVLSQNIKVDSLKNELKVHQQKDTSRVNILNALAQYYYKNDVNKALDYINESETISENIDFKKGIAESLYVRGIAELEQSNFDKAIDYFNNALVLNEEINLTKGIADCYVKIAKSFNRKNDFNTTIEYYKKSIKYDKLIGNTERIAISLKYIGYSYFDLSKYDDARIHFDKALAINLANNFDKETSSCYNIIGSIFLKRANYPIALEYYNKSLSLSEKIKDTIAISRILNNIGIIYKNYENYDKALENYKKALAVQIKIGNKSNEAAAYNNIGSIYLYKEDYNKALEFYSKALSLNRELNNNTNVARNLNNIANIYQKLNNYKLSEKYFAEANLQALEINYQIGLCNSYLGLASSYIAQKKYNKSLDNALKSKELSTRLKLLGFERDVCHLLSDVYKHKGDFKNALINHKQFKKLNDSLFNKKNIEKITQLEYEYKYKQELDSASIRELQLTQTVKSTSQDLEKSQRNLLQGVIAFLLVALVLGSIIFFLKLRNEKAKTQNIAIEQKLLRSQMTPHFIFNSLSVLQGMILNKEEKKSVSYLSKFSKLLRTTLESSRHKLVPISEELSALESYMALQNLDVSPPYNYTVSVDSEIDQTDIQIPPMLIQPFIENAIEHAFPNKKENKEIDVVLSFKNKKLACTIIDNGIGIDTGLQKTKMNKKSLATTITSERLKMLSKDFKIKGSITIEDRQKHNKQGTIVTLVIPYKIDKS